MAALLVAIGVGVLCQAPEDELAARVDVLIGNLGSEDPTVRRAAIEALGGIGPEARAAIPALEAIEDDPWADWARRRIGPGPLPFAHEVRKTPNPIEGEARAHFQYELVVGETGQVIPLGPVFDEGTESGAALGMDIDTLFLRWLDPGRMLWVSWETVSQGSGHHQAQGNLILEKSDGAWRELLRDWRLRRSKGSIADYVYVELEFEWDDDTSALEIREKRTLGESFYEPKALTVDSTGDSKRTLYARSVQFTTEWTGRVVNGTLVIGEGVQSFCTSREQHATLNDVAAYLSESHAGPEKRSKEETLAYLLEKNGLASAEEEAVFPLVVGDGAAAFLPCAEPIYETGS